MHSQDHKDQVVWSMHGVRGSFESLANLSMVHEIVTEHNKTDLVLPEANKLGAFIHT